MGSGISSTKTVNELMSSTVVETARPTAKPTISAGRLPAGTIAGITVGCVLGAVAMTGVCIGCVCYHVSHIYTVFIISMQAIANSKK